jgi:hypothetical protein
MADIHGSPASAPQMGAAPNSGPAPVPYAGALPSEPPAYGVPAGPYGPDGAVAEVVTFPGQAWTVESAVAHDVSAGTADAPYAPGSPSPVYTGGDNDAGGRDDVSGTVAGAVASAEARFLEHQSDTYAQGSTIGDVMTLPPGYPDAGTVGGLTGPEGEYYDPPRGY